jgi:hypothetical protein
MKARQAIFPLIAVLIFALLTAGCKPGPVEIGEVVICKNVDSEYNPVEPTTVFPSGTDTVYAAVKVNNITPEDKVTTIWNYLETGEEINVTDFTTEESGSGYIAFSIEVTAGFPTGRYNVVVYLNDEEIKTVEFSVE